MIDLIWDLKYCERLFSKLAESRADSPSDVRCIEEVQTGSGCTLLFLIGAFVVDVLINARLSVNILNILWLDSCLVLVILKECDLSLLIFCNL